VVSFGARLSIVLQLVLAALLFAQPPTGHLRIDGTRFVTPDGATFQWRGITAFRLLDYMSEGESQGVREYLAWARSRGLTVVRVLAMLDDGFFDLPAAGGHATLPHLLELARAEGVYVEVVGLTETAKGKIHPREQITALGRIVAQHPNAILELANEPYHGSQSDEVRNPGFLKSIADAVPGPVPVALGSVETDLGFGAGDYVTWHVPRESKHDGWAHVLEIVHGADLITRFRKPVVSDEPIGAAAALEPGRRDNNPDRFRAAAVLTRLTGMGATFHYDSGLHTRIPAGTELACFDAWNDAWKLLPADIEHRGVFRKAGDPGAAVSAFDAGSAFGVFERHDGSRAWVVVIRPAEKVVLRWADGWSATRTARAGGVEIIEAAGPATPAPPR
jgi:hypothetical protein